MIVQEAQQLARDLRAAASVRSDLESHHILRPKYGKLLLTTLAHCTPSLQSSHDMTLTYFSALYCLPPFSNTVHDEKHTSIGRVVPSLQQEGRLSWHTSWVICGHPRKADGREVAEWLGSTDYWVSPLTCMSHYYIHFLDSTPKLT